MKLSKEKRDRLILIVVTTVIAGLGLWFGVIKTRYTQLELGRRKLEAVLAKVSKADRWTTKAPSVETERQAVEQRLRQVEDGMAPTADPYAWSILIMEKARAGHNVEIVDTTRPERRDVQLLPEFPYKATVFTVRGIAHYQDLGRFLADFENHHPYSQVSSLTLSSAPEGAQEAASAQAAKEKLFFRMEIVALTKPSS